jgi:hypothetical protein
VHILGRTLLQVEGTTMLSEAPWWISSSFLMIVPHIPTQMWISLLM